MNVKKLLKIDIVCVFHCCALADLPRWIKQSLQQRVEDWKQRSKTLVDQIHEVDPYYVPTNDYRFIGQASYADIAAGRTNSPSSRNCSPYRHQREVTPPTMTAQVLRPVVMQAQKLTMEHSLSLDEAQISKMQIPKNDTNINKSKSQLQTETHVPTTDDRSTIDVEECHQAVPEVESSMPRRGRSPTRKINSSKVKDPKIIADQEGEIDRRDNLGPGANSRQETQTEPVKNSLAPYEERRGRSPSPMWVPGSTSYADILRGCIQTMQINTAPAQPPRQKMVSLSEESRRNRMEVPRVEEITEQDIANVKKSQQVTDQQIVEVTVQQIVPTQEIQAENMQIAETYCQPEISTEKAEDQNYTESEPTNWTDESLQDYNVLQHVKSYENVPRQQQPTEIYDYMIPETMPELVGFIGSHLGTYPVSSYVYAPSGHHQQVQQLDQISLNPYDNSSLAYAPEHYVAQTAYLSASDIYQQTPMQQPVDDMRHTTAIVMEKPVEVSIIRQSEVPKDVSATELIDKPEQQKSVNISNVETSTTNKTEGRNASSLNNMETKGQTFSYAQILSHGLSPRVTSTRIVSESAAANYQSKERSDSPKESLELPSRELSPLQEPKFKQESQSFAVTSEQSKQSKENDWDTMKKREVRKRQQHSNDKIKQTDEKKSRKPIDKPKEKQKNEKLTPPKQLETQDESFLDKISDSPMQKEEKLVQQEQPAVDLDTNPSQEKKRRQKKKKIDKSVGDEIDKALKEIEDMDKQKIRSQKDKLKEQNKEIKPQDSVNETIEKHNDEVDKKQNKSGEKSRKSRKSKEATRIKETISMEHAILSSKIKASDKNILKDNVEDKKDTKDAKVSDSKNEEEVQKDIIKEMSKDQLQIDNNSHINSNKPDNVTKCKNKIDKDTKTKEQNEESSENKMQYQSDVLSNNKKDKINIVDENNVTKDVKLLVTQKIELEGTNEKTNMSTKIENTKKHKDASKKEKNKTKSKELKLEAEDSNINQEKLEISTKEIIEDKSLKSIKPLIDIETKDSESKPLNITKIASDVNESKKSKTNPRKKDKASKNKIKSEAIIDPSSVISTSKVLDEIKMNLNGTEKYDVVPKSEQMIEAKIAEATVVEKTSKEILLPKTVQQIAQEIVQIDKTDKTYDSAEVKESKETEHQTNAKLEIESFTTENLEISTIDDKEAINNNTKIIEKIKKPEVEKCQIKTTKQKKSEKAKSNFQDKRKENRIEIPQHSENKTDKKKDELNIEFLIPPSKETVIQEQFSEKTNLTEQHVSVLNNSCIIQSKTDTENNYGVKIDEREDRVLGQVNKSTEKPTTLPETDLPISTVHKNVEIISTETLPKESEVSSEISNTVSDMEKKYQNIKNGKLNHHKETIIENEDVKTDINDKNSLLKEQDIKKSKDASKEKMSKRMKKKERLSPTHTAEQMKQSFYDKFQEEIVFKDDSTKKGETPKLTNLSLAKIDNVDNEKTKESPKKNEAETEFDSNVSSDSINKAQVYEKYTDETHNNLESEQPFSTGKALIIEKMITTVTTTTSVPGSVKVKPPDVKSVKSVEIIENIPLPKIVGSKVTELITLRPETVEASLTTTYARVSNDSLVSMQSDQAAISQKVGLTSAISTENIVISDEMALFSSVRDRRRVCSSTSESRDMSKKSPPMTPFEEKEGEVIAQLNDMKKLGNQLKVEVPEEKLENDNKKENTVITTTSGIIAVDTILQNDNIIEGQNIDNSVKNNHIILNDETSQADSNILIEKDKCINENEVDVANTIANNIQEEVDGKTEFAMECEHTTRKIKNKEIPESSKIKKKIVPEHLLDLIKPYAMDRHAYNHAESNFYRYFKVVKTVKKVQPVVAVHTRPESIERIVQDSVMKPIDVKSSNQEMNESNYRRHAFIIEAPKYPITSFYEFESQWIKMKLMPEKSVSISSDDSEVSVKTAIGREKQTVDEKEAVNVVSDSTKDTIAIVEKLKAIETNDSEDKDKKSKDLQQSVHLVSDDSWMSILDEPMMIEDDFDDTFNSEENTINKTVDTKLIDVESQDRTNEIQIREKQLSENISEVEIPSCIESIEEIREPTIILVSTSANNTQFNNNVKDLISITNDSIPQSDSELNVSVELSTEKISNQLTDAGTIINTNIQENKTDIKNNIETNQEIKETPAKISSVHLESDDTWMALLEEEIIIDDDFDELETETIKDSQIKKREEDVEIKEAKTKQQIEEKEIKKKKSIIEKQEDEVEQKELIIEEQQEKIEKEAIIEKPEEIKEKNAIEKHEEDIEIKEQKTEILNNTSPTEIAVKDEYHTSIKDIQNKTAMDEKQSDKTKNQPRKKKESKHVKITKTKDQTKTKTTNKQSDDIKTDVSKDDLSLQSNLEERKLENKSDCETKEAEQSLIVDKQQIESHKDKEECEKREERKSKSKKSKKQNQKSEVILKEKSALVKCEGNLNKDDNIVLSKATESDVFEEPSFVENQQDSKGHMPKYDSRLNPNAKSWAAIVGTRGITETTVASKDDFLNTQTSAITQDTNDNVTNVIEQPQAPTEYDSCKIPSKEETLTTHLPSLENQTSKNVIEELKATVVDEIKPIEEKSTEPLKQFKESNKSYAQVTASSRRTSPQISQEETYSVKPIPLKTDHSAINVKTAISNEMHEDFITEKLQNPLEQDNKQDEIVVQSSDYQTVITNLTSQEESIPWVEEVEKETMAVSVNPINTKDNEIYVKPENTWAAIVGKKSVESNEVNDIINLEPSLPKPEQNIEPPMQVQICVEKAPKQEPIENLVQVDEQGFIEFVNRKELRSRRSRSRSRNARQDNRYANKEIKTLDIKFENSEDIKAKEEIENKIKQSVQKTENEQRTVDESDELTKIIKEENAKSSKSRDKDNQKNDSNENKMQFAENKSHVENKIIQETKSESSATLKGKKTKSKNKAGKNYMKQQSEIKEHKELKHIEKPKEDKKSANDNKTEHNKIQSENIEDQSIKETELIKDTEHAQENKCKDITALPIINQDNTAKSKKKKNKKGKFVTEQLSESTFDIVKKTVIAGDLEKKTELPVEPKLDEVKLEEVTTDITCNIFTYLENEEIPAEKIKKQENIKQVMISTEKETTEKESVEQKMIVDESKNAETCKESHLEKIEKNIKEEKEIHKFSKAEKRKQKKKVKIAQSKFTDSSENISTVENIKITEIEPSKDKIDDESIIEIQSVQREEIVKPLEKFETVNENETSLPHITLLKDKQKAKSKSKSKKEKRQQDDKIKSQNFTTTFTTEPKEIETLSIAENTEVNLSKDTEVYDITQTKEENVKDQILNDELTEILQSPKNVTDKDHFSIATETIKQEDIKALNENVPEAEEVPADNILTEKTEIDLPQTEESKFDDILKLHDTINNDITKIESVLISDKTNDSVDETETETPINHVCMQTELPCDSINTAIKHSLPSDKLSSTVQQSFEDDKFEEDKLKCIASTEQENSDILIEPSKSKVQFYIADEILVLNPDRRKHVPSTSFLQEQFTTDSCNLWFLSIDDGFWPDKRPYHEAERDHFENLALHTKKSLSHDSKRDSDDRSQDHDDDDNSGGGSGGSRSWDSCGNSCSLLGIPQTERMIADLPGGICSWSDYSTYLSSESERTIDHNLPLGTIEDPTLHSSLSLDNSLPDEVQSSSPPSQDPQTESCMESLANAEITLREYPVSSSNSFQSSNHPSTCTKSSTFVHLPQSKLHLGKETRERSVQRCSLNGEVERETAKGEAERIRRIQVRSPSQPCSVLF